ncbi:MAG: membrane protein insertase YidC [Acidiferrobacterales bacterium]|nr:membrane protein insertase YidC [Acidiferrobacterales bacterium]
MENQRPFLIMALMAVSVVLYLKWIEFTAPPPSAVSQQVGETGSDTSVPSALNNPLNDPSAVPSTPSTAITSQAPTNVEAQISVAQDLITVTTDLVIAKINTFGGTIESVELLQEPIKLEEPDKGFPLIKRTEAETFIAQDGLLVVNQEAPNHVKTQYTANQKNYDLAGGEQIQVPLRWVSQSGVEYVKTLTFSKDSYVVDIDYQVTNRSSDPWNGYLYAQFSRTEPQNDGGSFGRLPSYTGAAIYEPQEKYKKIDFGDIRDRALALETETGWVAMLQHYFVAVWMPSNNQAMQFYTGVNTAVSNPVYRAGYKTLSPVTIATNQTGNIGTEVYIGSKEQKRLKALQKDNEIEGLALTVDYGFMTFIADPLFIALSFINGLVNNWGWAIIILTFLIKLAFYPLSAASFRSMAAMRKMQPRMKTLKERYKDDRQKFQMEMMALYKKEKINPAGGCLPMLIQIPVFLALYWVLLESVEMRQAPFTLWWQDLSAPDPFFVLPVLYGLSMFLQFKLNPTPMDDIQKKVMMIMPIGLTVLFITFPQGLVLYWVVNNILTMAQQWFIYRQQAKIDAAAS